VFWRFSSSTIDDNVAELKPVTVAFVSINVTMIDLDLLLVRETLALWNAVACRVISRTGLHRTSVLHRMQNAN